MGGSRDRLFVTLGALAVVVAACSGGAANTTTATTLPPLGSTTVAPVASQGSTTTTAVESAVAATLELRVPFEIPADAEFDVAMLADGMSAIFAPYPDVELLDVAYDDGFLVFSLAGAPSLGLCEDLFNALGAGASVLDCGEFFDDVVAGGPPAAPAADDFPEPDYAAAQAAVEAMLASVVVVTADGGQPAGTGFFMTPDGYILTNRHVVEGKSGLRVVLFDGTDLAAQVVGVVAAPPGQADIAVLDVAGVGFPAVTVGDPDALTPGDVVLQLGHPLGYGFWLASGGHYLGSQAGDVVTSAVGDTGFSGSPMFGPDGNVVALLWGSTSGPEGVVDFAANAPRAPSSIDVVWGFEEFQALSPTRVNTAGVSIDTAMSLASLIIERGGDVGPSDLVMSQVIVDGSVMVVPAPIDPETFSIPDFIFSVQDFVLSRFCCAQLVDMTLDGSTATFVFDVLPPEEARREIIDLLVGTFGAVEFFDLRNATAPEFPAPLEDGEVVAVATANLDSVVALTFPFGSHATGFFISDDGYILTNAHNVSSDPEAPIVVVLSDGTEVPARLVGYDLSGTPDVAVLDVDGSGYDAVEIGDYGALQAGDTVALIGHPGGIGFWVVSGGEYLGPLGVNDKPESFATTAVAGPGNSGSPFFNGDGEVVGLLWGNPNEEPAPIERTITDVFWDPVEFWALKVHGSAGHPIDVAMATASRIIESAGNVP